MVDSNNLIYGLHTCTSEIKTNPSFVSRIFLIKNSANKSLLAILNLAKKHKIKVIKLDRDELSLKCKSSKHQGIALELNQHKRPPTLNFDSYLQSTSKPLILIIDNIQDPHNLGACIRTANASGVQFIIKRKSNSTTLTPVAYKVASGGTEGLTIIETNSIAQIIKKLQKFNIVVIATEDKAERNIFSNHSSENGYAIVVGSESTGIRPSIVEICDYSVNIPIYGSVNCLNMSVATGIALYALRENLKKSFD